MGHAGLGRILVALIVGQICLHACMTGVRMAAPLQALREGHAAWVVGVLMGLFAAAPIALALQAGRLADRRGYHHPMRIAVALTVLGGAVALAVTWVPQWTFAAMCVAALLVGAGANVGLIAIQRTAGRHAADTTALKRVFSWLGLAPALANVIGPVIAGTLIDLGGFRAAYAVLLLLPMAALAWARRVPKEVPRLRPADGASLRAWDLLRTPGLRRLLAVNWLLSSSWDVHAFLVPVLGHERGFAASAIGLVLGVFALAVALGLALGAVQPMIMTTLHQLTPAERHGEAIALRSMTINFSSALMPLLFGALGAAVGASALFWLMGAAVGAGSLPARRIAAPPLRT